MSVAIRLMRFGKKGYPTYRIVVKPKQSKRDGAYIESLGFYNPNTKPSTIQVDSERVAYWLSVGAQLSDGVARIKDHIVKKVEKKAEKKVEKTETKTEEKELKAEKVVKKAPAKKVAKKSK